jgi:hypothetical protein
LGVTFFTVKHFPNSVDAAMPNKAGILYNIAPLNNK